MLLVALVYWKVFNLIEHDLLTMKLKYYGFSNIAMSFMKSYLCKRTHHTRFGDRSLKADHIASGVP